MRGQTWRYLIAGGLAGVANGFFGGGGGSVFVPLLTGYCRLDQRRAFATSVAVILPLCALSVCVYFLRGGLDFWAALPYLVGGTVGGWAGGKWFRSTDGLAEAGLRPSAYLWGSEELFMSEWVLPLAVGAATGVLSGFGVGGGTLLLVYMTAFAGVDQHLAQGINLLYFLPAGLMALPAHVKNGYIEKPVLLPAIGAGLVCAALAAWAATAMEVGLLRKFFGAFLIVVGLMELFGRTKE